MSITHTHMYMKGVSMYTHVVGVSILYFLHNAGFHVIGRRCSANFLVQLRLTTWYLLFTVVGLGLSSCYSCVQVFEGVTTIMGFIDLVCRLVQALSSLLPPGGSLSHPREIILVTVTLCCKTSSYIFYVGIHKSLCLWR